MQIKQILESLYIKTFPQKKLMELHLLIIFSVLLSIILIICSYYFRDSIVVMSKWLCVFIFGIYLIRTVPHEIIDSFHRGIALPLVYLFFTCYFIITILLHIDAFLLLHKSYLSNYHPTSDPSYVKFMNVCFTLLLSAFVSNFSRSFYMIHYLEQHVFGKTKTQNGSKEKVCEYLIRLIIVMCFIIIEKLMAEISKMSSPPANKSIDIYITMCEIGLSGFVLYFCMLIWIVINYLSKLVPVKIDQIFICFFGLVISLSYMITSTGLIRYFSSNFNYQSSEYWNSLIIAIANAVNNYIGGIHDPLFFNIILGALLLPALGLLSIIIVDVIGSLPFLRCESSYIKGRLDCS